MAIDSINKYLIRPVINSSLFRMAADPISALANNVLEALRDEKRKVQRELGDCCTHLRDRLCPRKEPDSDVEESDDDISPPRSPRQGPRVQQQEDSDSDVSITPRSRRNRPLTRHEREMDRLEREMEQRDREIHRYNTIDRPITELMSAIRNETFFYSLAQLKHRFKEFIHSPYLRECTDAFIVEMIVFCWNEGLTDEANFLLDDFNKSHTSSSDPARRLCFLLVNNRDFLENGDELIDNFFTSREDFSFLSIPDQIALFKEAFENGRTEVVNALLPNMKLFVRKGTFSQKALWKMIESDSLAQSAVSLCTIQPEENPDSSSEES